MISDHKLDKSQHCKCCVCDGGRWKELAKLDPHTRHWL